MKPAAFRHANEGVLFTADGHKAYLRGEKPKLLWPEADRGTLEPTKEYRIGILAEDVMEDAVLMFYRRRPTESP